MVITREYTGSQVHTHTAATLILKFPSSRFISAQKLCRLGQNKVNDHKLQTKPPSTPCAHGRAAWINLFASCAHCRTVKQHSCLLCFLFGLFLPFGLGLILLFSLLLCTLGCSHWWMIRSTRRRELNGHGFGLIGATG